MDVGLPSPHRPFMVWGLRVLRIKAAVLGFFLCQDGGLLEACHHRSGQGDLFRKVPPMISIGHLMHGYSWIRWDSVACTLVFSDRSASGGCVVKLHEGVL
jgi:hypothetical protein